MFGRGWYSEQRSGGKSLRKGETFVRAGEASDSAALVNSGIARMFSTRRDGKEFNKAFAYLGITPESLSRLSNKTRRFGCMTLSWRALAPLAAILATACGSGEPAPAGRLWSEGGAGRLLGLREPPEVEGARPSGTPWSARFWWRRSSR